MATRESRGPPRAPSPSRGLGRTGNSQGCRGLVAWPRAFPSAHPIGHRRARRGKARRPSPTTPPKASYGAYTRPPARQENSPDSSRSFTQVVPVLRPQVRVTPASQRPRSSRAFLRRDGPARGKRLSNCLDEMGRRPAFCTETALGTLCFLPTAQEGNGPSLLSSPAASSSSCVQRQRPPASLSQPHH